MTDREFVETFENCTLSPFHHADHVRLAWIYLRDGDVLTALTRFRDALQRYAASRGASGLYHETITWAYLLLIHERMARSAAPADWDSFAATNPDLLTWKPSVLDRYYEQETLMSDLARRTFVMPRAAF